MTGESLHEKGLDEAVKSWLFTKEDNARAALNDKEGSIADG